MATVATSLYPTWHWFWEDVEKAESLWYRSLDEDGRQGFELTIENMVRESIPVQTMARLRELWSSLPHTDRSIQNDFDLRWNLGGIIEGPDEPTDEEVSRILIDLGPKILPTPVESVGTTDAMQIKEKASHFLKELKHTALITLWNFVSKWWCYLTSVPRTPLVLLHEHLFEVAVFVVLCEMS